MAFNWKALTFGLLLVALVGASRLAGYYHEQLKVARAALTEADSKLNLANATIDDMQVRQRDVAALDEKYTKELADAQKTIGDLRRDVDSGVKRLRLAATCSDVRKTAYSSGVDDAASPRPTDAAERDYFTLRERIETSGKMIAGLQDYIRQQCMR